MSLMTGPPCKRITFHNKKHFSRANIIISNSSKISLLQKYSSVPRYREKRSIYIIDPRRHVVTIDGPATQLVLGGVASTPRSHTSISFRNCRQSVCCHWNSIPPLSTLSIINHWDWIRDLDGIIVGNLFLSIYVLCRRQYSCPSSVVTGIDCFSQLIIIIFFVWFNQITLNLGPCWNFIISNWRTMRKIFEKSRKFDTTVQ